MLSLGFLADPFLWYTYVTFWYIIIPSGNQTLISKYHFSLLKELRMPPSVSAAPNDSWSSAKSPNLFHIEKAPLLSSFPPFALFSGASPFFHSIVRGLGRSLINMAQNTFLTVSVLWELWKLQKA